MSEPSIYMLFAVIWSNVWKQEDVIYISLFSTATISNSRLFSHSFIHSQELPSSAWAYLSLIVVSTDYLGKVLIILKIMPAKFRGSLSSDDGSFPPSPAADGASKRLSWSKLVQKLSEFSGAASPDHCFDSDTSRDMSDSGKIICHLNVLLHCYSTDEMHYSSTCRPTVV